MLLQKMRGQSGRSSHGSTSGASRGARAAAGGSRAGGTGGSPARLQAYETAGCMGVCWHAL